MNHMPDLLKGVQHSIVLTYYLSMAHAFHVSTAVPLQGDGNIPHFRALSFITSY